MDGKRQRSENKTTITLIRTGGIAGLRMTASGNYAIKEENLKELKATTTRSAKIPDAFNHLFEINGKKIAIRQDELTDTWKKIYVELEKKLKYVKHG